MKNLKKTVASLLCTAALVGGLSTAASAATFDTNDSYSGKVTAYSAGRW